MPQPASQLPQTQSTIKLSDLFSMQQSLYATAMRMSLFAMQTLSPFCDLSSLNVRRVIELIDVHRYNDNPTVGLDEWCLVAVLHATTALQRISASLAPLFSGLVGIPEEFAALHIPSIGILGQESVNNSRAERDGSFGSSAAFAATLAANTDGSRDDDGGDSYEDDDDEDVGTNSSDGSERQEGKVKSKLQATRSTMSLLFNSPEGDNDSVSLSPTVTDRKGNINSNGDGNEAPANGSSTPTKGATSSKSSKRHAAGKKRKNSIRTSLSLSTDASSVPAYNENTENRLFHKARNDEDVLFRLRQLFNSPEGRSLEQFIRECMALLVRVVMSRRELLERSMDPRIFSHLDQFVERISTMHEGDLFVEGNMTMRRSNSISAPASTPASTAVSPKPMMKKGASHSPTTGSTSGFSGMENEGVHPALRGQRNMSVLYPRSRLSSIGSHDGYDGLVTDNKGTNRGGSRSRGQGKGLNYSNTTGGRLADSNNSNSNSNVADTGSGNVSGGSKIANSLSNRERRRESVSTVQRMHSTPGNNSRRNSGNSLLLYATINTTNAGGIAYNPSRKSSISSVEESLLLVRLKSARHTLQVLSLLRDAYLKVDPLRSVIIVNAVSSIETLENVSCSNFVSDLKQLKLELEVSTSVTFFLIAHMTI
jgi:hypothetical protein